MKDYIADLIFEIKQAVQSLREAVEDLEENVNSSPFDFVEIQECFEGVTENIEKLKTLLPEQEDESSPD